MRSITSEIPSRTLSAARTARSASSPCDVGAPKTAITASPMNFSSVPPCPSIRRFASAWYTCSASRTSSGSAPSARAVESDEVDEEDRDELALLPPAATRAIELRAAVAAETGAGWVLFTAGGAGPGRSRTFHVGGHRVSVATALGTRKPLRSGNSRIRPGLRFP